MKTKTSRNSNFNKARVTKNDEFYTQLTDIEKELKSYKSHFRGKVVYLDCCNPEWSNFWQFFKMNFAHYELKGLISTHYNQGAPTYGLETSDGINFERIELQGDGDFRSAECVEQLLRADIVVCNPPFSLFREYVAQKIQYGKKFLIIGSNGAVIYKEIFKLVQDNKMWIGRTFPKTFTRPDGTTQKFGNICWFTNMGHKRRYEDMILYQSYYENKELYPTYDNYNAINVDKIKDIPDDYFESIGVPLTFFNTYNPSQFEVLDKNDGLYINGSKKYVRVFIRRKVAEKSFEMFENN
jgi:hypothetical protein